MDVEFLGATTAVGSFHSHGGYPNSWMFISGKIPSKMDENQGYPYDSENLHMIKRIITYAFLLFFSPASLTNKPVRRFCIPKNIPNVLVTVQFCRLRIMLWDLWETATPCRDRLEMMLGRARDRQGTSGLICKKARQL